MSMLAFLPLVVHADDADNVKAGWIPLLIVLAIGAAIVFLWFSMNKQLRKIKFEENEPAEEQAVDA
ncbi:MAG: hypothetical protein QM655_04635 [Nocardioidaceae bacterium]